MKSALSAKLSDNKIIVVENFDLESIKTAAAVKALKDLKATEGALIVLDDMNENAVLSVRNIPDVKSAQVNEINVFDIMKYDSLLVTKAAVEKIQEVYA
jgi:large subunit ribosomal protein L4